MVALHNDNVTLNEDIFLVVNQLKKDIKKGHSITMDNLKIDYVLFKMYFKLNRIENSLKKQITNYEKILDSSSFKTLTDTKFDLDNAYDIYMETESLEITHSQLKKFEGFKYSVNKTIEKMDAILDKNAQCINYLGLIESKLLMA